MPFRLRKKETIHEAVQRISGELIRKSTDQLQRATTYQHNGEAPPVSSPIHEARKQIKKLRALVRLVRDRIEDKAVPVIELLRDAGRLVSGTRDRQAMVEVLDSLAQGSHDPNASAAMDSVREILTQHRDQDNSHTTTHAQNITSALDSLKQAAAIIQGWSIEPCGFAAIKRGLHKACRDAKAAMQIARDDPTDHHLHEWRKQVKTHWYHIRLLRSIWPAMMQAHAGELGALSDQLGEDHDLSLLALQISTAPFEASPDLTALRELIHQRQSQLRVQAFALGAQLFAEKPAQLMQRLHAYWRLWHAPRSAAKRANRHIAPESALQSN